MHAVLSCTHALTMLKEGIEDVMNKGQVLWNLLFEELQQSHFFVLPEHFLGLRSGDA